MAMTNDYICRETELTLNKLAELTRNGQLIGVAFVGVLRGRSFTAGWAGEAGRDPVFTMGALGHLYDDLLNRTKV
jgi:hypothetical protein